MSRIDGAGTMPSVNDMLRGACSAMLPESWSSDYSPQPGFRGIVVSYTIINVNEADVGLWDANGNRDVVVEVRMVTNEARETYYSLKDKWVMLNDDLKIVPIVPPT